MILILLVIGTIMYVKLAMYIIGKIPSSKQVVKKTIIILFLLVPFIDVLAGYVVFFKLCLLDCGTTVNEKIKRPASIYIDDKSYGYEISDYGVTYYNKESYLFDGVDFVEMNAKKLHEKKYSVISDTGLHRYYIGPDGQLKATKIQINEAKVGYLHTETRFEIVPVIVRYSILYDRNTGKLLSKNTMAGINYVAIGGIPYFNWLHWFDQTYNKECNSNIHTLKHLVLSTLTD